MRFIRGIITAACEGMIKRFGASGHLGESVTDRELFQHYGFTSMPQNGAEVIILNAENHIVCIGSDDRRYRIAIQQGEVALYTDEGDYVKLGRGRNITVIGGTSVQVQTPTLEITGVNGGQANVTINGNAAITGNPSITGNLSVTGNITSTGSITGHPVVNG
jgi:phage baseplate assembly protein V